MKKFTLTILFCLFYSTSVFSQGVQGQLDNIFGEMSNYTAPGAFETQRRSGFYGGRFTYKTAIFDATLVNMKLPSARGGCGGIDIFGGSFSFINSDQIVALLRQVAANAAGYAFQLALDTMCSQCMKWMNELQSKMQSLNQKMSNSCQLAQGLVNDVANISGLKEKEKAEYSILNTLSGAADDISEMFHVTSAAVDSPASILKNNDPDAFNETLGSVVWKALKEQAAENWFNAGDDELLETIMSLTGSVVVKDLETGSQNQGETTKPLILPPLSEISLLTLIEGAQQISIYDCSLAPANTNCMIDSSSTQTIDIDGLQQQITEAFVGPDGLISRIRNNQINTPLSQDRMNILASMPSNIGSQIFALAPVSPDAAEQLIREQIGAISLEYVHRLVRESFRAAKLALSNHQAVYKSLERKNIDDAEDKLNEEYQSLLKRFGSTRDIASYYADLLQQIPNNNYLTRDAQNSNKAGK